MQGSHFPKLSSLEEGGHTGQPTRKARGLEDWRLCHPGHRPACPLTFLCHAAKLRGVWLPCTHPSRRCRRKGALGWCDTVHLFLSNSCPALPLINGDKMYKLRSLPWGLQDHSCHLRYPLMCKESVDLPGTCPLGGR